MFRRGGNNAGRGPDLLGVRIGKWIVWILFIGVEYALVGALNRAMASGGNTTLYWVLIVGVWIVFYAIEKLLKLR